MGDEEENTEIEESNKEKNEQTIEEYKEKINALANSINTIDNPPISLSDNVENFVDFMNLVQAEFSKDAINKDDFKRKLTTAVGHAKNINSGFSISEEIEDVEKSINEIADSKIKEELKNYFNKTIKNRAFFKSLENSLKKEVEDLKSSFNKHKEKHPAEFYELSTSLKEFANLPNINAVFLGLEDLAFKNKNNMLRELLSGLDKVSNVVTLNFNRFVNEKLNPAIIKDIFKKTTGKEVLDIFKNENGLLSPQDFKKEFRQVHDNLKKLANNVENYKEPKYKPIYGKLLNFYWNSMIFYETIEQEITNNKSNMNNPEMYISEINQSGNDFAIIHEKYAKLYNPDELNKIVKYVNEKSKSFNTIYHKNYMIILQNYKDILQAIENRKNKTGIKPLILKIINAEINNQNKEPELNKLIKELTPVINSLNNLPESNKQLNEISATNGEFSEIEKDIGERLGKIVLIDENSIKLFNEIHNKQKIIINDINKFIEQLNEVIKTEKFTLAHLERTKNNYKDLIRTLKNLNEIYHKQIIKNYKSNLDSMNKFIDNFDLMYGIKDKLEIKKIEEKKDILNLNRFDFNENDLDAIKNETLKKQEINNYFQNETNNNSFKIALTKLGEIK